VLGRPLKSSEVETFMHIARRIAALLALNPDLDANYRRAESLHQGQIALESPFGENS